MGIVGCGRISRVHVAGYGRIAGATVVAAADPVSEMRDQFGRDFGVRALYEDYREMVAAERLDAISICTWPPFHHQMVLDAASAGVRVIFCEKPIALNLREADEMLRACEREGVLLVVNHFRRFAPIPRLAKEIIDRGDIGALERIHAISMGDLLTDGTHTVDLLRFYNDDNPVVTVFGQVDTGQVVERYGHWTEAGALVSLGFDNGVRGLIELGSAADDPGHPYQRVILIGSAGSVDVLGDGDQRVVIRRDGQEREEVVVAETASGELAFADEVEKALEVLEHGGSHPLGGASARSNLEILIAVYDSARTHKAVRLPVTTQGFPLEEMVDPAQVLPEIEAQRRAARLGA